MAEETGTTAPPAAAPPAEAPKVPTAEEFAKVTKALQEANAEAAKYRAERKSAEQQAADAAKAKAEAEGNWKAVIEAEKAERAAALARVAELEGKASKVEEYEGFFASKAKALREALADRASFVSESLPLSEQVRILEGISGIAATGKPPAARPASGSPAGSQVNTDFNSLPPDEQRKRMASMTPDELRELGAQRGVSPGSRAGWSIPVKR